MAYLLAALLGGFFLFNSQASPEKVEKALQSTLQSRFPGAQVGVDVEGKSGRDVVKGRFNRARIEMSKFALGGAGSGLSVRVSPKPTGGRLTKFELALRDFRWNELHISSLDLEMQDVAFNWKMLRKSAVLELSSVGNSRARAEVPAASLASFVTQKLPNLQNARVTLSPNNKVRIVGTRPAPIVNLPVAFELNATLEIRQQRELWLSQPTLQLGGVPLAAPLTNALLRDVNPVYVLDAQNQWPLRVQVRDLQSANNALQIDAALSLNSPAL